jgi:hypothetical protein
MDGHEQAEVDLKSLSWTHSLSSWPNVRTLISHSEKRRWQKASAGSMEGFLVLARALQGKGCPVDSALEDGGVACSGQ